MFKGHQVQGNATCSKIVIRRTQRGEGFFRPHDPPGGGGVRKIWQKDRWIF